MSGGVDSSVAAALLVAKKYDVTGAFMVNYDEPTAGGESCWTTDYRDAVRVAAKLGIKLIRLDFTKEYKKDVLDYMYKEYEAGRTPNPDVLCNKFIKFGAWLKKAKELGFDKLATGHYARIKNLKMIRLLQAKDKDKDQTYFLHQLAQEQLRDVLFPIGEYRKPQVRKFAKKFDLPTAEKEESMGICFIGEVRMEDFLKDKIKSKPGKIAMTDGTVLGEHRGLPFYTIGQRSVGINADKNWPVFVVDKNFAKNEVVVGFEEDPLLYKKEALLKNVNWIIGQTPKFPLKCEVRLRHRQPLQKARISELKSEILVKFTKPQRAITPGQFAVFYKKGECLGGGVIC